MRHGVFKEAQLCVCVCVCNVQDLWEVVGSHIEQFEPYLLESTKSLKRFNYGIYIKFFMLDVILVTI